ncbi:MAG: glutamate--tRNA ligase [Opitutales bacterium]
MGTETSNVRVRFAPSPTGSFHIGIARTALFNWLYARHTGGTFVLRIEDTDKARNTEEALEVLLDGLRWLGLNWDEGPEVGGDHGPYFQNQRGEIYEAYLAKLKSSGRAYEQDGATWFRIEGERRTVYDERRQKEVEKVDAPPTVIEDRVRGRVEKVQDEDFVIVRSNGDPSFHFVNVVDDLTMGITHVLRGEDHLSNTPKHIELFNAFGAKPPVFAHIPLILKGEGSGKMSKRDKGALIEEYQQRHYLPAAVRNYLVLLGWNPKDDREVMPIEEIIERFDFAGINKGNARFDEKKLTFINTEYLRALPLESFAWMARPLLNQAGLIAEDADEDYVQAVLSLAQPKARSLEDLPEYVRYCFADEFTTDAKALAKLQKKGDPQARIRELAPALEALDPAAWTVEKLESAFNMVAEQHAAKPFDYYPATRLAATGQSSGPELLPLLTVLGQDRVVARLRRFAGG